jgi:hypothetical protein
VLVAPVLGSRLARVPVIVHAQEAPTSAAATRLFRVHGALADTVVAISPWIAQAFDGARANVLANPVGIPIPRDPAPREPCAADRVRVVVVGTVDRHKRQDLAVSAVHALRDRGLDAELTVVGLEADAAYAAEVRAQARALGVARQVHFAGPTSDVAAVLLAADALLLPAGEVTPLVVMEAMALRTPVVAARMGSIPDVVSDEVSGLLVAPGDPAALAAAVVRLRRERGLAQRIAEGGRRRVEEHFDETASHRRLSAEIRRLAAGPASRLSTPPRPAAGRMVVRRRLGAAWRRTLAAVLRWRLRISPAGVAVRSSTTRPFARRRYKSRWWRESRPPHSNGICVTCGVRTSSCRRHGFTARCSRAAAAGGFRSRSPSTTTSRAMWTWPDLCFGASAARPLFF